MSGPRFNPRATESMRPRNMVVSLALAIVAGLGGTILHTRAAPDPEPERQQAPDPFLGTDYAVRRGRRTSAAALKRAAKKRRMARARAPK